MTGSADYETLPPGNFGLSASLGPFVYCAWARPFGWTFFQVVQTGYFAWRRSTQSRVGMDERENYAFTPLRRQAVHDHCWSTRHLSCRLGLGLRIAHY